MSQEHHTWQVGREPPFIRAHSLTKHRVLASYLERYVSVLTAKLQQTQLRLTLVDGFAGGGRYLDERTKEERPGSPLIMLNSMRRALESAKARRSKEFNLDVDYFFIEKNSEALAYLRQSITESEHRALLDDRVRLIQGDFIEEVPSIIEFIKGRGRAGRVIFVLDQFGYREVPLPTIKRILAELDNAEVILTFATDFLIDYINDSDETQQRIERLGMVLPKKAIQDAKAEQEWRRLIQFLLHKEIPERTGAAFYTPFFIRSVDSHRDFWLVHLSGHHKARDVMVGLHWAESNSFAHYGRSGLRMLGYDPKRDSEWTRQSFLPGFFFDQEALSSSKEELLVQLPQCLQNLPDGVTFVDLFAQLTNDTPVTSEIMQGVVDDLAKEEIIEVRDATGTTIRRVGIQHGSDLIVLKRQMRLFPFSPDADGQ